MPLLFQYFNKEIIWKMDPFQAYYAVRNAWRLGERIGKGVVKVAKAVKRYQGKPKVVRDPHGFRQVTTKAPRSSTYRDPPTRKRSYSSYKESNGNKNLGIARVPAGRLYRNGRLQSGAYGKTVTKKKKSFGKRRKC